MWRFHSQNPSLLLSKTQNLTLCSDKRRKKRGGILSQNLFFDCIISHLISKCYSLSLYLSPGFFHLMICRTRIVYSVSDWTLLKKKKNTHTSEHRFNARTRVWNTLLKSTCTGFVKIHKNHSDTAAHTVNGVHSNVQPQTHSQTHAHTHDDLHVILKKKQIYLDFQFPIWSHKSDIYNHTVTAQQTSTGLGYSI